MYTKKELLREIAFIMLDEVHDELQIECVNPDLKAFIGILSEKKKKLGLTILAATDEYPRIPDFLADYQNAAEKKLLERGK